MENLDFSQISITVLKSISVVFALFLVHFILKHKNPFFGALKSALPGIICLVALNLFDGFTGIKIPINSANISASALLGLPGLGLITILSTLFSL